MRSRSAAILVGILAVGILAVAAVLVGPFSAGWLGGPKAPEEIPERRMSLALPRILAVTVIDMSTGVGGFRRVYTDEARRRAERRALKADMKDVLWTQVLDYAVAEAGVEWDWKLHEEEWVIWVHMPGEDFDPESLNL